MLILAEGEFGIFSSKTAACLVRYAPEQVAAVLDSSRAGRTAGEVIGCRCEAPVVASLEEAMRFAPDTLVPGIAPQGAVLPDSWRPLLREALQRGLRILSGLHLFLGDDPELAALAAESGVEIIDLRRPPAEQPVARGRARETRALRLLTVGTDCNVGKMCAAWEMARANPDLDARFIATGQTGMMLAGDGVTLDRVPGDFMAGIVEQLLLRHEGVDLLVVEGQGSLLHPAYSPVTLALLHGAAPDAMVLVHHLGRREIRYSPVAMPPLTTWIRLYEDLLAPLHPGRVAAIAVNAAELPPAEAARMRAEAAAQTGLPVHDALEPGGARALLDAALLCATRVRESAGSG